MSEEKEFLQPAIPRFDGHYDHWSMLMENLLRSKGLWSLVENGFEEPRAGALLTDAQQTQLENARVNDLKVKNYLFQSIDRVILEQILGEAYLETDLGFHEEKVRGQRQG